MSGALAHKYPSGLKKSPRRRPRSRRELAAILEIGRAFTHSSGTGAIFRTLFEKLADLLEADRAYLLLLSEDREELVGTNGWNIPVEGYRKVRIRMDDPHSGAAWVVKNGLPLVSEDARSDARLNQKLVKKYGEATVIMFPLINEGIPQGVLLLGYSAPHRVRKEDISLGQTLANEAALALERYRLIASLVAEKERAQAVAAESARKDLYIQRMLDPLWVGDAANGTIDINPAFTELLKYSREEILGKSCFAFFASKSRRFLTERVLPELAEGRSLSFEADLVDRDGLTIPALVSASSIIEDGRLTGNMAVFKDIRERKSIEQEAARLQRIELERAKQEEMNHIKAQFVANISHELRTPLNAIIGFNELVLEGVFGEINAQQAEYLGKALRGSRRLLKMVTDLILIAQIQAGRVQLIYDAFLLDDAIGRVVRPLKPVAQRAGVSLSVEIEKGLKVVKADQAKICTILDKLLDNAIKFTPAGGSVVVRAELAGNDLLEISVSDTGIGFGAQDIERLADAFTQETRPEPHPAEGAGLGLAVAQRLAELHEGRIMAESKPGAGSTFRIIIPIHS